jgi:hypothetical protein
MNNPTRWGRSAKKLSQPLDHRLKVYAIAAGAAGVSLIALSQAAEAEIVYTPAHANLPISRNYQYIDINGDGVPDFAFLHYTNGLSNWVEDALRIDVFKGGVITLPGGSAAVLPKGAIIGASGNFATGSHSMAASVSFGYPSSRVHRTYGPWSNVRNRYVGVSFTLDGETHYGWFRLDVTDRNRSPMRVLVTGYAYETIANKSLRAGQTSGGSTDAGPQAKSMQPATPRNASLGMLAAGSPGLTRWRRKDEEAEAQAR